jgi:hypothetical protein
MKHIFCVGQCLCPALLDIGRIGRMEMLQGGHTHALQAQPTLIPGKIIQQPVCPVLMGIIPMLGQQYVLHAVPQHAVLDITCPGVGAQLQAAVHDALHVLQDFTRLDALGSRMAHVLPVTPHVLLGVIGLLVLGQIMVPVIFAAHVLMVRS